MSSNLLLKGNNQENAKELNRALVLELIWKKKVTTRKELSVLTGLKQATITNIVNDLIGWKLLRESGKKNNGLGRHLVELEIVPTAFNVLAIRFTRKFFLVGVYDLVGNIIQEKTIIFDKSEGFRKISKDILKVSQEFLHKNKKIISVGVALPGPIIKNEEEVTMLIDFPEVKDVNIKKLLEEGLNIPVRITHDANAGLIAEWIFAKRISTSSNLLYIAAGQGNGLGMILNGNLYEGANGTAGELGHTSICFDGPLCQCGNYGCLDLYCSVIQLSKNIERAMVHYPSTELKSNATTSEIISAVKNNDELAIKELKKIAYYLSIALINLINTYNPGEIIIGDELSKAGDILVDIIKDTIQERIQEEIFEKLSIRVSDFEGDSVLLGAAVLAISYVFKRPYIIEEKIERVEK